MYWVDDINSARHRVWHKHCAKGVVPVLHCIKFLQTKQVTQRLSQYRGKDQVPGSRAHLRHSRQKPNVDNGVGRLSSGMRR